MKRFRYCQQRCIFALATLSLIMLLFIPIRLAIASYQAPQPQAIFTLGGGIEREKFTAEFARQHSELEIWISSGSPPDLVNPVFQAAMIPRSRLHLDYRAVDTVTNFTTLVADFKQRHIHHIYLITSDIHMPKSRVIATIVLGSNGIICTPVTVPSLLPRESVFRIVRDLGRSLVWIFTGRTGASYGQVSNLRIV